MALKLNDKVIEFLKNNPNTKFAAREIATWVFETYPAECEAKRQASKAVKEPLDTDEKFINQLRAEIGARRVGIQKKDDAIKSTEDRPRKFFFSTVSDEDMVLTAESKSSTQLSSTRKNNVSKVTEHSLYPILANFLKTELNIYSKRIDEGRASNKNGTDGNRWLFPDVVGLEDLTADWTEDIKKTTSNFSIPKVKLYSFEVKTILNRSNVRKSFFQTVSNSSWANYSYLVASEIQSNTANNTMKELQILANLHGIGFILLDKENFPDSQILIPATEKKTLDLDVMNRISENRDFKDYIEYINNFLLTGKIYSTNWDKVDNLED